MNTQERLSAIAMAVTLRDNSAEMQQEKLLDGLQKINEFQMFSIRQIAKLSGKSHSTISRLITKKSRSGGRLNPAHLENMRTLIFQKDLGEVDYHMIKNMIEEGTSADVIEKITGISKSTIYRKYRTFTPTVA